MGGSSIKKIFRKKKKSRWKKAWKKMKKALPTKKRKKKSNSLLDRLNPSKKKNSQKEKESKSLKRVFLGNSKEEPTEDATPAEKKDDGALGKLREQIKSKICRKPTDGLIKAEEAASPVNLEETQEQHETGNHRNEERNPKRKLKEIMKSIRPTRSRTNDDQEKEA